MTKPFTIQQFTRILRPSEYCGFMEMCWNFYRDAECALMNGETHYEIPSRSTKSGHPETIWFL